MIFGIWKGYCNCDLKQILPWTRLENPVTDKSITGMNCTRSKHQEGHLRKLDNMLGQALLFHIIVDITQRTLDGTEIIITHPLWLISQYFLTCLVICFAFVLSAFLLCWTSYSRDSYNPYQDNLHIWYTYLSFLCLQFEWLW